MVSTIILHSHSCHLYFYFVILKIYIDCIIYLVFFFDYPNLSVRTQYVSKILTFCYSFKKYFLHIFNSFEKSFFTGFTYLRIHIREFCPLYFLQCSRLERLFHAHTIKISTCIYFSSMVSPFYI